MKIFRYPGVRPFESSESALFFGRDRDIVALTETVRVEPMVVLFGRSGYGKSSLLNAGVLPRLRQYMMPVEVRLGEYTAGQSQSPVDAVIKKSVIGDAVADYDALPVSLWTHFKKFPQPAGGYLLVFDQFEEFFSYPLSQQRIFRDQLSDLLSGEMPDDLREASRALEPSVRKTLAQPVSIRVLFAIRSDRMHELDRLKDRLPSILHKRYELKALSEEQARDAIVRPAGLLAHDARNTPDDTDRTFASPCFEYRDDALKTILEKLTESNTTHRAGIEAFQLQILCDSIETLVIEGKIPDRDGNGLPDVTAADLPDFRKVFTLYYERRLEQLPEKQREAARLVIEDGLIRYDPATDEGRRLSVDGLSLLRDFEMEGLTTELLHQLENTFLARREPNTLGGYNYELSHDTLLAPVIESKKRRIAQKEEERREKERLEAVARAQQAEAAAAEERRKAEEAERLQKLADEKTKEAQAHLLRAQAEEEKSRLAYEDLQRAMDDIRKKNRTTFESFAALGVELITRTEHEDALKKIAVALEVEVEESLKESGLRLLLEELLYFFAEGNRRPGLARSAAAMLLRIEPAGRKRELLVRCVEELWTDRGQFGILLRELSGYDHFQRRYYPVFVGIVPSGSTVRYEMGSTPDEWGHQPEELKHQVELGSYDMSETAVTFYHYSLYCESTGRGLASRTPYWGRYGDHPVVNVSWYETVEYCIWLNGQREMQSPYQLRQEKGSDIHNEVRSDYLKWLVEWDINARGYRLPTEAEWEYAARGGAKTEGTIFSGSNEVGEVGWYWKNSGDNELDGNWDINRVLDNNGRSHPVGEKKSNEVGLYDMSGNVWEWCWDWYDSGYYESCLESGISRNPVGPVSGKDGRVLRGGSWFIPPEACRVAYRDRSYPNARDNTAGFRLVLVP